MSRSAGEYGYGIPGVLTLPEFRRMLDDGDGQLRLDGKPVASIAYIYCVGSRCDERAYCSRFCCSAAVHASLLAADRAPNVRQYHLYRDLRTYGKNELMVNESRQRGSLYMKFADDDPPEVAREHDRLAVTVRDQLTDGEELTIPADLVVLVTGMVPRSNDRLIKTLKLPVGGDGFFNEIHPKLRPVETVVDGVLIAGACQGPKTVAESVTSGLAAVAQAAAVLKRGVAELDPQVATVHEAACTGCGGVCRGVPVRRDLAGAPGDGREVATIDAAGCKGCGACAPVCPEDAIDLQGYTDAQVRRDDRRSARGSGAMSRDIREIIREEPLLRGRLLELLQDGPLTVPELATAAGHPQDEVMIWIMGLRKYGYVAEQPGVSDDGYYRYAAVRST